MKNPTFHQNQYFRIAAILVAFILLLTACQQKPAVQTAVKGTPKKLPAAPITTPADIAVQSGVRITIWHTWEQSLADAFASVAGVYEAAHPSVKVTFVRMDNLQDTLKPALAKSEGPDIIALSHEYIPTFAQSEQIVDLDRSGISPQFLQTNFTTIASKTFSWQGKVWGLPLWQDGKVLLVNKKLVAEDTFPVDQVDMFTWIDKARIYQERNPRNYLICSPGLGGNDVYSAAPVFLGIGLLSFLDEYGNGKLGSPAGLRAGEWLQEFSKYSPKETSEDICRKMFIDEQVVGMVAGMETVAKMKDLPVEIEVRAFGKPWLRTHGLMVTRNAVERNSFNTALDLVKYLTGADAVTQVLLKQYHVPVSSAVLKSVITTQPILKGFVSVYEEGIAMPTPALTPKQLDAIGKAVLAIYSSAKNPEDALLEANNILELEAKKK
ncbi:MAG TPA: extracellular solute-binding protein [Anaerolineaceae bacterium]